MDYVNGIVGRGLSRTIGNSLQYIQDLLDPRVRKEEMDCMLEIFLRLEATSTAKGRREDAEFSPYLSDPGDGSPSIEGHLEAWFRDFLHVSTLLGGRIDTGAAGLAINPAAFTFQSMAVMDALKMVSAPVIELHISNIHTRGPRYTDSLMSEVVTAIVAGLGARGYPLAVRALIDMDADRA